MKVKLKELGVISTGNTPSKNISEFYDSKDIGFVKPDIISDAQINYIITTTEYISEAARCKARIVSEDAVLVTCIGSIGKIGIAKGKELAFNQQINAIEPNEKILPKYLAYSILANKKKLEVIANAPVVPIINKTQFGEFEIDITDDVNEQARITKLLDKVSALILDRKTELKRLDDLIKARFVEMFGEPEYNSSGWNVEKMCDICKVGSSKRIYQSEQSNAGVPFLRISDLVNRMDTGLKECDLYIPEERYEELEEQGLIPKVGDILLTARGTLGRCYIYQKDDKFYFQDGMITWLSELREDITPLYISYLFLMEGFRKQIDKLQAGSTVAYLSISMTKKLDVMIPPLELQIQFKDFVEQVDKSKVAVQKALDEAQLLFDSLMEKYFGENANI